MGWCNERKFIIRRYMMNKTTWKDNNMLLKENRYEYQRESKEEHKIYKYDRDCYFIDFENALDFVIKDVTRGGASRYVYDHYSPSLGSGDITIFFGPKKEDGEWAHIESIEEIPTLD